MKTYFIYHIPGIKIGCTSDLQTRMRVQSFTEWEILEEHTDIYEVSDREIQLQKDYGLPVDKMLYYQKISHLTNTGNKYPNRKCPWNVERNKQYRKLTFKDAEVIRSKYKPRKYGMMQLAKDYNVSYLVINKIINKVTYTQA